MSRTDPRPGHTVSGTYDLATLLRVIGASHLSHEQLAVRFGTSRRQIGRWVHGGLTVGSADRVAFACGWHPINIWPDWADDVRRDEVA